MLDSVITVDSLKKHAGSTVFQRGQAYFAHDAVGRVRVIGNRVKARVEGSEVYEVELWDETGRLGYDCTCPHAAEGNFCKHCVALGLAWLDGAADWMDVDDEDETPVAGTPGDPWNAIQAYLESQSRETLAALLLESAQRDDRLYQSLLLKAGSGCVGADRVKRLRQAINAATQTGGFVDWEEAGNFAADLEAVVDTLDDLLDEPDSANLVIDLTEYAIQRAEEALNEVDDSNGEVWPVVERLGDLHLDACIEAYLDPTELAERLFRMEMLPTLEVCGFGPLRYQPALGKRGLQRYRELVEPQWRALPPPDPRNSYERTRSKLTDLMRQLAKANDDIEELVAIESQDLSGSYRYLHIANIWTEAGQPERALEWAERGLAAFPEKTDNRLRDFLVAAYLERGRRDEALALTWVQFDEQPGLMGYQKLKAVAERLGIWPEQRERALKRLEEYIQTEAAKTSQWRPKPSEPNYSPRVEIALWEEDPEAGLEAIGRGTCDARLLLRLAGQLEAGQPDEAMKIYRRVIQPTIEQTNNHAYEEAVKLIRRVGELMKQQDRMPEFREYVEGLRARYKAKRNFIKLLDGVRTA
jgi:uncharacterized Zn finger protein